MDGLYLLWWVQEKQMSPALVAATMAAGDLLLMGLEVPTGWFADKFGNRRSLILGSLIQVAGMICCWLADGMSGLVLACLLVSVGDAFRSGADQALLYRTCVELDREGEFQTIEARSRAVHVIALAALIVAGGAIVSRWGFAAGWMAEILLCATGGLIACAMVEPPERAGDDRRRRDTIGRAHSVEIGGGRHSSAGLSRCDHVSRVFHLADDTRKRPWRGYGDRRADYAGRCRRVDARNASAGCRAARAERARSRRGDRGGHCRHDSVALVPATIALAFATGVSHPLRAAAIQRMTSDSMRARAASAANACDMAFSTVVLLLAGHLLAGRP